MIWIIDPGHEGMSPGGLYLRAGKQSPEVPPGIYEGEFNHDIARRICAQLDSEHRVKVVNLSPGPVNIQLGGDYGRIAYVNRLVAASREECRLISIHSNADGNGARWTDAHGMTTFISKTASSTSEMMANCLQDDLVDFCQLADRGVRKKNFAIVHKTRCPAVLLEIGFMTNLEDVKKLADEGFRFQVADTICRIMDV